MCNKQRIYKNMWVSLLSISVTFIDINCKMVLKNIIVLCNTKYLYSILRFLIRSHKSFTFKKISVFMVDIMIRKAHFCEIITKNRDVMMIVKRSVYIILYYNYGLFFSITYIYGISQLHSGQPMAKLLCIILISLNSLHSFFK